MKKLLALSAILTIGLVAMSFSRMPQTPKGPVITFESLEYDFGNINWSQVRNDAGKCEFKFTNTGDEALIITGVRADCGCTTPSYTQEPVLPGKTGKIAVQYDNSRVGYFNKGITVTTNANPNTLRLTIKGTVIKDQGAAPVNPTNPTAPTAK
jgi:hypothetical protein